MRPGDGGVSELRPYVITRGRVAAEGLAFDTLLAAVPDAAETGSREGRRILDLLGDGYLTVAEVAATLRVPLGTAQVVSADLAALGAVRLFGPSGGSRGAHVDDRDRTLTLLGSVIDGIGEL